MLDHHPPTADEEHPNPQTVSGLYWGYGMVQATKPGEPFGSMVGQVVAPVLGDLLGGVERVLNLGPVSASGQWPHTVFRG